MSAGEQLIHVGSVDTSPLSHLQRFPFSTLGIALRKISDFCLPYRVCCPRYEKASPMEDKFSEGELLPVGGSAGSQFAQCAQEPGGGSGIIKRVKGDRRRELWRFRPETNL
jgi:hypothetical protein